MFRKLKKATSAISKKDGEKKDEPKEVKADTAVPEGPRDDDKEKKKSLKKKKSSRSRSRSKDKDDNNGDQILIAHAGLDEQKLTNSTSLHKTAGKQQWDAPNKLTCNETQIQNT